MFVPYSTDAPVYYWPLATVGLIAANVVIFAAAFLGAIPAENWMISFGDGLHPDQWLLSIFMHAGPDHLIGNMIFLWVFGLVVEGKLGWWKFLCCYLAIGMCQMGIQQAVMLGYEGEMTGALGASGAIFGLMAMAMIWAPMNEITFFYWIGFFMGTYDISIATMAGLYTSWEIVMILLSGGAMGSGWLHLTGFLLGLPLGIVLLKRKIVDCEGWDAFNVWAGTAGDINKEPKIDAKKVFAAVDARQKKKDDQMLDDAAKQFRVFLQNGNVAAATKLFEKMRDVGGGIKATQSELLAVIQSLHGQQRWKDSAPIMADYIAAFPGQADPVRIKLAQICVVELQRPEKALELLWAMDLKKLPEKQVTLVKRITAKAEQMRQEGVVELDVETW
jgi:membrane associated rhomboid family serine protease